MGMDESGNVYKTSAKSQYIFALFVNLLTLSFGFACGWASPNNFLLKSDDSPLPSGKITTEESSWITSLMCVGALIGNYVFTFATSKFGRKKPLISLAIPSIAGWALILFAQNVYYLYAGRLLTGIVGGGMYVIVPQYFAEVSSDRVRGVIGSTIVLSCNGGILLAYVFGHFFNFYVTPAVVIGISVAFAGSLFFFPESPSVLMKQNKLSETEESIRFYQSMRRNTKDYRLLQLELNKLQSTLGDSDTNESETKEKKSFKWSDLTTRPGSKAMTIGIVLALLNQLCGCFAMLQYTATIFEEAGSSMHPNVSAIVVGVIQVFGSYAATVLVDRAGRKFLFCVSTIGVALGLTTLGVYMMLKTWGYDVEAFNWIPLASFSFSIFIASWAILTLPFLVISEVMPDKLKDFGTSFCMTLLWISQFIMLKFLPLLTDTLGFHGSMFLFAGVCVACTVFIILFMPETKGRSYEQIMKSLS